MENSTTLREQVHQLVDDQRVQDELLERVQTVLNAALDETGGWDELTPIQQNQVLAAREESLDAGNLLDHETVKKRFAKWLEN